MIFRVKLNHIRKKPGRTHCCPAKLKSKFLLPKVEGKSFHVFKHYKLFISLKYKHLKYLMNMFVGQQYL